MVILFEVGTAVVFGAKIVGRFQGEVFVVFGSENGR